MNAPADMVKTDADIVTRHGSCRLQHGPLSDRVYIMDIGGEDAAAIAQTALALAAERGYGKVFAKVPAAAQADFAAHGYTEEARIPDYYAPGTACCFMCAFLDPERAVDDDPDLASVLDRATKEPAVAAAEHCIRACSADDADAMADLYGVTFDTYPFPIADPAFIAKSMAAATSYFGIWDGADLLALASAEADRSHAAAEMTDFAVRPEARGRGMAHSLLAHLDAWACHAGVRTGFTIARAVSHGMNLTFARQGYRFGGRLINNTNISGRIESMNIWYKPLTPAGTARSAGVCGGATA